MNIEIENNLIDSLTEYLLDAMSSYKKIKYWVNIGETDYNVMQNAVMHRVQEVTNDEVIRNNWIKAVNSVYGKEWFKQIFEEYAKMGLSEEVIKNSIREYVQKNKGDIL